MSGPDFGLPVLGTGIFKKEQRQRVPSWEGMKGVGFCSMRISHGKGTLTEVHPQKKCLNEPWQHPTQKGITIHVSGFLNLVTSEVRNKRLQSAVINPWVPDANRRVASGTQELNPQIITLFL